MVDPVVIQGTPSSDDGLQIDCSSPPGAARFHCPDCAGDRLPCARAPDLSVPIRFSGGTSLVGAGSCSLRDPPGDALNPTLLDHRSFPARFCA